MIPALLPLALLLLPPAAQAAPAPAPTPAPGPAATDRPVLQPTRDVVLGYHLAPGSGEPINVRVSINARAQAMRMDLPDQTFMVALPPTRQVTLVVPLERTAMNIPWSDGPAPLFLLDDRARYTRKAEATVAGQRCTLWDVALDRTRGTVCVSPDGVLLRSQSQDAAGRRSLIEAFAIRFQALVESDFAIPPDFERLEAVPRSAP